MPGTALAPVGGEGPLSAAEVEVQVAWLREGIETVVREALRHEGYDEGNHPDFITWKDSEVGWLRIPWGAATLEQLRWMAEYRAQQARDVQASADDLAALAEAMEEAHRRLPHTSRLSSLWAELEAADEPQQGAA